MELEYKQEFSVKRKLEIEMKLLEKSGIRIEIEFFQNGNNTAHQVAALCGMK